MHIKYISQIISVFCMGISFITLPSCTFFLKGNLAPLNIFANEKINLKPVTEQTYCPQEHPKEFSIVGSHQNISLPFELFLKKLNKEKIHLSLIDQFVLWALLQMNIRPDHSSPSSRLQILLKRGEEKQYWDFSLNDASTIIDALGSNTAGVKTKKNIPSFTPSFPPLPYLYGLDYLLNYYHSPHSLTYLAQLIDHHFKNNFTVSPDLKTFLDLFQGKFRNYPMFLSTFFKDDEVLKIDESLPRLNFSKLVTKYFAHKKNYLAQNKFKIQQNLIPYSLPSSPNISIQCNSQIQHYEKSTLLTKDRPLEGNLFGIQTGKGYSVLAFSSQSLTSIAPLGDTFLIQGEIGPDQANFCFIEKDEFTLSLVSSQGRDPGQHVYQFLTSGIETIDSLVSLDHLLKKSRHLLLTNPPRLAYESHRGNSSELNKLISLDLPLYHAPSLGNIWIHANFYNPQDFGFIIDDRQKGFLLCTKLPQ